MSEWLPIALLLKTPGRFADLYVYRRGRGMRIPDCQWTGGGWLHAMGGEFIPEEVITHYMDIPYPPTPQATEAEGWER